MVNVKQILRPMSLDNRKWMVINVYYTVFENKPKNNIKTGSKCKWDPLSIYDI